MVTVVVAGAVSVTVTPEPTKLRLVRWVSGVPSSWMVWPPPDGIVMVVLDPAASSVTVTPAPTKLRVGRSVCAVPSSWTRLMGPGGPVEPAGPVEPVAPVGPVGPTRLVPGVGHTPPALGPYSVFVLVSIQKSQSWPSPDP